MKAREFFHEIDLACAQDDLWKGLQSLAGRIIGVKRGFNYGDKWRNAGFIRKYSVDTIRQGFRMLKEKRQV